LTTQRPDSNLPPTAQQWRRSMEKNDDANAAKMEALFAEIDRLANSDGGQAALYAQLLTGPIATLFDQLKQLYVATGNTYPPVAAAPTPPPTVPTYATIETNAVWSRTWGSSSFYTGGGYYTDSQMLYQGSNPENKIGMWGIDMGPAAGKTITDMQVFLQNTDYPWSSGGTAALGVHSFTSPPSGKPGRSNGFDVGWSEGQGKYAPVPPILWPGFSNGSFKGFTVGGIGATDSNSAIFMGVGKPYPPRLRITYRAS
jgi:hypothetical protein